MLFRKERCPDCPVDNAIDLKRVVRKERFIPELGKYVDCSCNPVLDESGEVLFVVEQLRDISDKKRLEALLKESAGNYRKIVNLSPDPMVVIVDGIIVLTNKQAFKYFDKPIGERINRFIAPEYAKIMAKRMKQILENKIEKTVFEYKLVLGDKKFMDAEIASGYFSYKGKPAILALARDVSERKKELNEAADFQRRVMKKPFPFPDKAGLEALYVPAKTVSGDFYFFHKVDESRFIGILGDVSGKGVSAALSISAFNALFHEAVMAGGDLAEALNILNKKVACYLGEKYIAACCFSFDFEKMEARVI